MKNLHTQGMFPISLEPLSEIKTSGVSLKGKSFKPLTGWILHHAILMTPTTPKSFPFIAELNISQYKAGSCLTWFPHSKTARAPRLYLTQGSRSFGGLF